MSQIILDPAGQEKVHAALYLYADRPDSLGEQAATHDIRAVIAEFLDEIHASFPTVHERDHELEACVHETIASWGLGQYVGIQHIETAITGTTSAYGHISSIETKIQIVLFTTLVLALDDPVVFESLSFHELLQKISVGSSQDERGFLGEFTKILTGMWVHYPVSSANTIFVSALRYVNASVLERESVHSASRTLSYVEYKRSMSATTEAYACFIWDKQQFPDVKAYIQAIPDVMLYVSYVNDILSFYKEELSGETDNYIHERACVTRKREIDTLREVVSDTLAAVERIRGVLGEGEARDAFESFAAGYVRVHMINPRYRLDEIMGKPHSTDRKSVV